MVCPKGEQAEAWTTNGDVCSPAFRLPGAKVVDWRYMVCPKGEQAEAWTTNGDVCSPAFRLPGAKVVD